MEGGDGGTESNSALRKTVRMAEGETAIRPLWLGRRMGEMVGDGVRESVMSVMGGIGVRPECCGLSLKSLKKGFKQLLL